MEKSPTRTPENLPAPDKPLLRGWFHMGAAPLVLIGGLALVTFAPTLAGRITSAIFTLTAVMMFGTSAVYHRGNWPPTTKAILRRMDHANIFLIIVGTYTPLCVLLLDPRTATIVLSLVWGGAILGILTRVLWLDAPRWVYVPLYVILGSVVVGFLGPFYQVAGALVVILIAFGGLCYIVGAVVYGTKWPRGSTKYFGFHEIFHALTIAGFASHFAAAAIVVLRA